MGSSQNHCKQLRLKLPEEQQTTEEQSTTSEQQSNQQPQNDQQPAEQSQSPLEGQQPVQNSGPQVINGVVIGGDSTEQGNTQNQTPQSKYYTTAKRFGYAAAETSHRRSTAQARPSLILHRR